MRKAISQLPVTVKAVQAAFCLALCGGLTTPMPCLAHGSHHHHHHHDEDHDHDHDFIALNAIQIDKAQIAVVKARAGLLSRQHEVSGKVITPPHALVQLAPQVAGTALAVYKKIGDEVYAGEPLALLRSKEMAEAKSAYLAARQRKELHDAVLAREERLAQKKISAQETLWQARTAAAEATIDYELCYNKLIALGLTETAIERIPSEPGSSIALWQLSSPSDGVVVRQQLAVGQYSDGHESAFTIADTKERWLELAVPASLQPLLKKGMHASIAFPDGQVASTTVIAIQPLVDEGSRTVKAYAHLNGATAQWHPGTHVTALLEIDKVKHDIVLPKESLQTVEGVDVVFVEADGGFEIRPVLVADDDGRHIAIKDGLLHGERVAARNCFMLKAEHEKESAEHEH